MGALCVWALLLLLLLLPPPPPLVFAYGPDEELGQEPDDSGRGGVGILAGGGKTPSSSSLVIISTLDGQLTALDAESGGALRWRLDAGAGSLLASSISTNQDFRNGQLIIPSLDGSLFQWDGDSMKALPFTVESLLDSSSRLGDDVVLMGGKAISTYGILADTGKLKYSCTSAGCRPWKEDDQVDADDLVLVQRVQKTVRAVAPRSGAEKWNFSVGQYDIMFYRGNEGNFQKEEDKSPDPEKLLQTMDVALKVSVPDGKVLAFRKAGAREVVWEHKFSSPVAAAWLLKDGQVLPVSLFDREVVPALEPDEREEDEEDDEEEDMVEAARGVAEPSVYLGMYRGQMYIQSSLTMAQKIAQVAQKHAWDGDRNSNAVISVPRVKWKPMLATAPSLTPANVPFNELERRMNGGVADPSGESAAGALSVITSSNRGAVGLRLVFTTGYDGFYFLHTYEAMDQGAAAGLVADGPDPVPGRGVLRPPPALIDFEVKPEPPEASLRSMEVLASLVLTVVLATCVIIVYFRNSLSTIRRKRQSSESEAQTDSVCDILTKQPNHPAQAEDNLTTYVSRYLTDFEHVQCLGRGGFGVVFEARNKVDDCHYAIKRIRLPNRIQAREKVMREVKALAKLEHQGVVRYFNAWLEMPPQDWQEEKDKQWISDCSEWVLSSQSPVESEKFPSHLPLRPMPRESTTLSRSWSDFDLPSISFLVNSSAVDTQGSLLSSDLSFITEKSPEPRECQDDSLLTECEESGPTSQDTSLVRGAQHTDDSLDIVFEDSGCGEKSSRKMNSGAAGNPEESHMHSTSTDSSSTDSNKAATPPVETASTSTSSTATQPNRPTSLLLNETHTAPMPARTHVDASTETGPVPRLFLYIQMQLCRKDSLKEWLNSRTNAADRSRAECLTIFQQIVNAVQFLHVSGLMHRDLKPSNIFFSLDGVVKIGDFGLVTGTEHEEEGAVLTPMPGHIHHTGQVGTKLYMSPEQLAGRAYSHKVDIFSLGLILFELLCPFGTQMERIKTLSAARNRIFPDPFVTSNVDEHQLVERLLAQDPSLRPEAEEIAQAALFAELDPPIIPVNRQHSRTHSLSGIRLRSNSFSST
ncbi:eukaryotic translation initiation factor 2-alpha kinase 3 isoform X2 [Petromyzon marinus]|uniref:non-specific serine/threonine protein kinase n=1 Tax=Petromyzon marinus TaxID=7757 RepID=A0AAJ7SXF0_PETMA|nr:eukaryotic translation initiation factor 2-alpha kinase 3 isoform X2 [Petromyzon marinus]